MEMLKIYNNPPRREWPALTARCTRQEGEITERVAAILSQVRTGGDKALRDLVARIEGYVPERFEVSRRQRTEAAKAVPQRLKTALAIAKSNIEAFHRAQLPPQVDIEVMPGVRCVQRAVAIGRVGLYIPGGNAPLFSTVLMLALPARIAGCGEVVLCTPAGRGGKIAPEVGKCGTRLCKLDVAWVGEGYEFALNGCKSAFEGIESNTNERGFVWAVCGWAGTQRYSTVWSGDQVSNWDYIRYHIPTITGAGLSAMNAATSDVDGIFGGSPKTYTRDLQWKVFTPIFMTMSGWADADRQPWVYGNPYTDINRKFLKLKMRLNPYAYTYCHEAHTTGVPMARAMVLEFPDDVVTRDTTTQYQFMSGEWMMVAPVYTRKNVRDSIYFPAGEWYDYWTGKTYEGGKWLDKYEAKLDICPVFIRQGAIIPMYPDMNYVGEKPADVLTLDLYPYGNTSFNLYEDDGLTRDYKKGEFACTLISVSSPKGEKGTITVDIAKAKGDYKGRYQERTYLLDVRSESSPSNVTVAGKPLSAISPEAFNAGQEGWYFDASDRMGRVKVRTNRLSTNQDQKIVSGF